MAGVAAIVQTLKQDDHVIYVQCTNGDSDWLFRNKWKDFGIQVEFIYSSACESILQVMRPNTKVCRLKQEYKTTSNTSSYNTFYISLLPQPKTSCKTFSYFHFKHNCYTSTSFYLGPWNCRVVRLKPFLPVTHIVAVKIVIAVSSHQANSSTVTISVLTSSSHSSFLLTKLPQLYNKTKCDN